MEIMKIPFKEMNAVLKIVDKDRFFEKGKGGQCLERVPKQLVETINLSIMGEENQLVIVAQTSIMDKNLFLRNRNDAHKDFFNKLKENATEKDRLEAMFDEKANYELAKQELNVFLIGLQKTIEESCAITQFVEDYAEVIEELMRKPNGGRIEFY